MVPKNDQSLLQIHPFKLESNKLGICVSELKYEYTALQV